MNALPHICAAVDLLLEPRCIACDELGEECQDCEYKRLQAAERECPYDDAECEERKYGLASMCAMCAEDCGYDKQLEIEL